MAVADVVVVGGGIAGLSALVQLAPDQRAVLLEREPLLATHASGRNAAIYRPLERDGSSAQLAKRSLEVLGELAAGGVGAEQFLRRNGLLLGSAERESLLPWVEDGRREGVDCELLEGKALGECASSLATGDVAYGVWVPSGGVLDLHAIHTTLAAAARTAGAAIRTNACVTRLLSENARIHGVALADGSEIQTGSVVIAAGAWGNELAASCGTALPLSPVRRHLVQLEPSAGATLPDGHPIVWRLDDEVYYRAESRGVLASPCDAAPWPACDPPADAAALEMLARKLARTAPMLASAKVRRYWACLRTFAPDRELVVGADPRIAGLYWLAGLGGHGMAVAPAAGEVLAACVRGEGHALKAVLAPGRLASQRTGREE
jgi:D-arginine dehydrogenase